MSSERPPVLVAIIIVSAVYVAGALTALAVLALTTGLTLWRCGI